MNPATGSHLSSGLRWIVNPRQATAGLRRGKVPRGHKVVTILTKGGTPSRCRPAPRPPRVGQVMP